MPDQAASPPDCDFCGVADRPSLPFDISEPMDPEGQLLLKPSLGMVRDRHFLAISTEHVTSFASSGLDLDETEEVLGRGIIGVA